MISYSEGKGKWKIPQGKGIVFCRILCYGKRKVPKGGAVGHILRKEVGQMRITFHVKDFTVTIVIKRRKSGNRHPGR